MDQQDLTYSSTEAQIDLGRIRSNVRAMRRLAGRGCVMAVVKANAYGHGSVEVASALLDEGVEFLAVAQLSEALELRRAGIQGRIVVFGVPLESEISVFAEHELDLVAGSDPIVRHLAGRSDSRALNVHVQVDTGMHRLGIAPQTAGDAIAALQSAKGVRLAGLWTHLASSDEPTNPFTAQQIHTFAPIQKTFASAFDFIHIAASSGVWNYKETTVPAEKAMVRLGISLYGYLEDEDTSRQAGLLPAMCFVSRVAQIRRIPAGDGVSYNRTWTAPEDTVIATVAAGYADGYSRILSNCARVGIGGKSKPVVGTVCMDMFMVALGPPGRRHMIKEGDEVVLFGEGGPSAFEVATWSDTIVYEVCTNISSRVRRSYY